MGSSYSAVRFGVIFYANSYFAFEIDLSVKKYVHS